MKFSPQQKLTSKPWTPRLQIDEQTLLACQALAARHFVKHQRRKLCMALKSILDSKFPNRRIEVVDKTDGFAVLNGTIQCGVVVDGAPDQGLIFHKAKPDGTIYGKPAND